VDLLNDSAFRVADFDFTEVQFSQIWLDLGPVAHGQHDHLWFGKILYTKQYSARVYGHDFIGQRSSIFLRICSAFVMASERAHSRARYTLNLRRASRGS